jgi:hypothetical protein
VPRITHIFGVEALAALRPGDGRGILVAGKIARVICEEEHGDDRLYEADTVPNLLVIERVLDDVRDDLAALSRPRAMARFDARDRILRGLLAPRFGAIAASSREILAVLVAAGRAPSPFVR